MNGIFEIHISIDPKDNYVQLLQFVESHKKLKGLKLIFAVSSKKVNQYMLSYFTRKIDEKYATQLSKLLTENNITVVRIKVESHGVKGNPITNKDLNIKKNMVYYLIIILNSI